MKRVRSTGTKVAGKALRRHTSTAQIVEKLYQGNGLEAPQIPKMERKEAHVVSGGKGRRKRANTFEWQPTGYVSGDESDNYNWEYFMDAPEDLDKLFVETNTPKEIPRNMSYDQFYETNIYKKKKRSRETCGYCADKAGDAFCVIS
mmetsp:Transcript_6538/g.12931  ORF Transcript_6538/g.12931 Transcript_6538/m.12931 type:complete len:146 (+) Transcript_6538:48-485(+)